MGHQVFKNTAIWGWWQGKNLGDLWIKDIMASHFPGATFMDSDKDNFADYEFVIIGGGGLFPREVWHTWKNDIPVPYGAIGLGAEFKHPDDTAKKLAKASEFFFIRDANSLRCMNLTDFSHRSFDVTFAKPLEPRKKNGMNQALIIWRGGEELHQYPVFESYIGPITSLNEWDMTIRSHFETIQYNDFETEICNIDEITQDADFIISGRYHGIIAAIQRNIPCVGIDICPKIREVMRENNLEEYCLKLSDIDKLDETIEKAKKNAAEIRSRQQFFVELAREKVLKDFEIAKLKVSKHLSRFES